VRIGQDAFGLKTHFVTARAPAGQLVGVLPLVEQRSLIFGQYLVSLPFFTYGGVLASDETSALELVREAGRIAAGSKVQHLELRQTNPVEGLEWPQRLDKVSMVLSLPDSVATLQKQLGSKLRSQIKRAERTSPRVRWGGRELLDGFYTVFSRAMRDLGTPVYPRSFFDTAVSAFKNACRLIVVEVNERPEAVGFLVRHGDTIEVPWAAASDMAKKNAINMRMYWEMLCFSLETGAHAFDFGRSTVDSGTYRFKAQWGAQPMQLHWQYWLRNAGPLPQLNQSNPRYALAAKMWRRLPLWCANLLGPRIIRSLP
jgi:FemAB-related protein (PEP-CTERM system-associated)